MMQSLFYRWDRETKIAKSAVCSKLAAGGGWVLACVVLVYLVVVARLAGQAAPPPASAQQQSSAPAAKVTGSAESAKPQPGAIQKNTTPVERRRDQMNDESADLLSLALALKAEVDKTNKDMLSLGVIRKADEIERLARTMRQNLKQ